MIKALLLMFALGTITGALGCESQGPLEEAGEEADEAIEEVGDSIEDATDG